MKIGDLITFVQKFNEQPFPFIYRITGFSKNKKELYMETPNSDYKFNGSFSIKQYRLATDEEIAQYIAHKMTYDE